MGAATTFNGQGGGRLADWHDIALDMYLKQGLGADKISRELGLPFGAVNSFLCNRLGVSKRVLQV